MNTLLRTRLKDDEFLAMEEYLPRRIESLEAAMVEWRERRRKYEQQMEDCFDWRAGGTKDPDEPSEIFEKQNDSLNIVGGFAEFTAAKASDDIFGSAPFFALKPQQQGDEDLAPKLEKYSQWKISKTPFEDAARESIPLACALGEQILKVRWRDEREWCERERVVLVDAQTRQPIPTSTPGPDGRAQLIYEGDIQTVEMVNTATGERAMRMVVEKDPTLDLNTRRIAWERMAVEEEIVRVRGVDAYAVHFLNFFAPLNVASLDDADCLGQKFDMKVSDIEAMLRAAGGVSKETAELIETLRGGENSEPKTEGRDMPKESGGEQAEARADDEAIKDPVVQVAEVYFVWTVGGRRTRCVAFVAVKEQKILWCEYLANFTPRGRLPYHVIRPFKKQNRWYGRGYFEIFEKAQNYIDRHLNYVGFGNRTHRVAAKFIQRDAIVLTDEDEDFQLGDDIVHELQPGKSAKDALQIIEFPKLDDGSMALLNLMIQVIQVRSGITSAAQGEVSSLPSTSTATGIESILASGNVLSKRPITEITKGVRAALETALLFVYWKFDAEEAFTYQEGDRTVVEYIERQDIAAIQRNLELDVDLLLTRFRQRDQREAATMALDFIDRYIAVPDPFKEKVRPVYMQAIRGCGIDHAEGALPLPQELPMLQAPPPPTGPDGHPAPPETQAQLAL